MALKLEFHPRIDSCRMRFDPSLRSEIIKKILVQEKIETLPGSQEPWSNKPYYKSTLASNAQ
ncbi:hypothetical protein PtA15_10A43 [Puccinia triticina]|uniref:Uncharacterized protein n=1 Tax=Puccinia triticina TaxID=208348 RepID=A0ABY7CTP2_9BASI|nr:uncharacterized protein PtA15_10A43 [Puccinia triticina]WAQ88624.1 hypothetical protein PtA15_10A43 [Puccinia triticina]